MKKCSKCGLEKASTDFSKQTAGKDGLGRWCKKCATDYNRQWRKDKVEHVRAYQENNKERDRKKQLFYYEINKKTVMDRAKQWAKDNPGARKAASSKWRENNMERQKATEKRWRENNKARNNIKTQRRNTKKKLLKNDLTAAQWEQIKKEFGSACCYCGQVKKLTIEHFIPLDKFGELTINNVLPACSSCNSSKKNKDFFYWYPNYRHYSKHREQKILKFLNYQNGIQQLSLGGG
jgi:flagellar biosynthesis GTPase FlhF